MLTVQANLNTRQRSESDDSGDDWEQSSLQPAAHGEVNTLRAGVQQARALFLICSIR